MDQSSKDTLVKAVGMLKAGENREAAALLAKLLKQEPDLVQGWYMLGLALDDTEHKIRAFKRVLKLDPNHEKATQQIELLEIHSTPSPGPFSEVETGDEPAPVASAPVNDDFELPDWMRESTFDPSDYSSEIPEIFENIDSDIPSWAKQGVLESQDDLSPAESLDVAAEEFEQAEDDFPAETAESALPQSELTGYYDDVDEEDGTPIDWEDEEYPSESTSPDRVSAFVAEDEPLDDQPEWLRDMVEDDGSKKKQKKEKVPKKLLSPDQKRRRRKIITYIILIAALIGLGYGGYYYQDQIKPYVQPFWSSAKTIAAPVTDLLTQGAPITYLLTPGFNNTPTSTMVPQQQPTSEPTWTPSTGQLTGSSAGANPSSGGAIAITPTPIPLGEEIITAMQGLEEQIKMVRNLPGPINLEREIMTNQKLRQFMQERLIDDETLTELQAEEIVLRALGFINAEYDLTQARLNARGDALGGYYDPDLNKLNLVGSGFDGVETYIYAHEYAHALQDANFDLNSLGYTPSCTKSIQACLATRALVEGEASLVNQLWLEQFPPETGLEEINNYQPPAALFQEQADPPYYAMNNVFAYEYGLAFVEFLQENGGWNAVNRAYAALPETTEQILHPAKYQQRELPLFLDHPDLSPVFRNDWELLRRESLGEWETYLLLAYNDFTEARRPTQEAQVAAEGWGSDEYRVYFNPATEDVFLSVYWIWDNADEASQFYNSLLPSLSTRFGRNAIDGPGESGMCWFFSEQTSCLYQNEKWVLWLYSTNRETLEAAKEKFTKLP